MQQISPIPFSILKKGVKCGVSSQNYQFPDLVSNRISWLFVDLNSSRNQLVAVSSPQNAFCDIGIPMYYYLMYYSILITYFYILTGELRVTTSNFFQCVAMAHF